MTALELILHLAEGSTTPNTLQHIAKIARQTIEARKALEQPAQHVKRWVWVFEDRAGDKYTTNGQVYTPEEAAESARILGVKNIGPTDEFVICWPTQPAQQEPSEANELLRKLGLDPEQYRTDGGVINHMKVRAAIQHPEEYQAAMQPMYQKLTNCVACGRLNPKEGLCDHGGEQPASKQEPVWDASAPLVMTPHPAFQQPAQRKPLTHEQRVDLLAKFEAHKHEWHAPAILIDMVEAAHGIGEKK